MRNESNGEIWFWDHEEETENSGQDYFYNIINTDCSFSDSINKLYEWVDPNESVSEKIIH